MRIAETLNVVRRAVPKFQRLELAEFVRAGSPLMERTQATEITFF
jgi:hypothetical protein